MPAAPVVSNTGPLIALACIDSLALLPHIYGTVHIPCAVQDELTAGNGAGVVVPASAWLRVEANAPQDDRDLLYELDDGEAYSILLARRMGALLLMDERRGRAVASRLGLRVTGTVGFLARCHREGLIHSFRAMARRLQAGRVYLSDTLIDQVAEEIGE